MASEEASGALGGNILPVNAFIEVSGDEEEGFKGSWSRAVLLADGVFTVKAQFTEFVDDKGAALVEVVERARVRPAPPPELCRFASMKDVQLGHSVEVRRDDVWWKGAVVYIATAGVHINMYESDGSITFERDPRNLRPRLELREDGCWHRVVPAKTALRKIGLTAEEAEEAIQAMSAVTPVRNGPPIVRTGSAAVLTAAAPAGLLLLGAGGSAAAAAAAAALKASQTGKARNANSPWAKRAARAAGVAGAADAAAGSTASATGVGAAGATGAVRLGGLGGRLGGVGGAVGGLTGMKRLRTEDTAPLPMRSLAPAVDATAAPDAVEAEAKVEVQAEVQPPDQGAHGQQVIGPRRAGGGDEFLVLLL